MPSVAAARVQRWAILLSAYNYDLKYRKGELYGNADGLSRLPLRNCVPEEGSSAEARRVSLVHLSALPVTSRGTCPKRLIKKDLLSKVLCYTMQGWPSEVESKLLPFFKKRLKIMSVKDGCLLWGVVSENSFGLRWTFPGSHVSNYSGCSVEVDGSLQDGRNYDRQNY